MEMLIYSMPDNNEKTEKNEIEYSSLSNEDLAELCKQEDRLAAGILYSRFAKPLEGRLINIKMRLKSLDDWKDLFVKFFEYIFIKGEIKKYDRQRAPFYVFFWMK